MFRNLIPIMMLLVAACGDGPTDPYAAVIGVYDLVLVDGAPVPASAPGGIGGIPATVSGGTVALESDMEVAAELQILFTGASAAEKLVLLGTYTVGHDTVYVRDAADGQIIPAILTADRLTAVFEGVTFTFDRRSSNR